MWGGTGVSGVILPIAIQWLFSSYGFRTALRIWSTALLILIFPLLYFLRPCLPISRTGHEHGPRQLFGFSFITSTPFLILQACNILEAMGFFLSSIFLPTFSRQILHSSLLAATATVITVNVTSVFGYVIMGSLIDRYHVTTCIFISNIGATLGTFLLWGFTTSLPLLYVFCAVYGFFAGRFSSTWTGIIGYTQAKDRNADADLIFSIFSFGRGIGNICSGSLSETLVSSRSWFGNAIKAYRSEYGSFIMFTGISALLGGCSFLIRRPDYL
jgi:MFS family permease